MPRYKVQHAYSAYRDGQRIGPWAAGEDVDVDAELADWVERDSPGALAVVRDKPEAKPTRSQSGTKGRG